MNYIGINGHRGAGKDLITYIISNTINYILTYNENPTQKVVNKWINEIIEDENILHDVSLTYIYIDSFGDTVKTFISLLLGCNPKDLYNNYYKDNTYVELDTFKTVGRDDVKEIDIIDNVDLFNIMKNNDFGKLPHKYMSMRNFILYFGQDVLKKFMGIDVWIKSLSINEHIFTNIFDDKSYKIFRDTKTTSEIKYIKDRNGIIISINRKSNKKKSGLKFSPENSKSDFQLNIPDNIYNIYNDLIILCNNIIKYFKNGKENN